MLLPSCHRRRLCDPEGWVYTHGPAEAHHSHQPLPRSLLPVCRKSVAEITPPEPVTLFNDMSGQNVIALLENSGKGVRNALSQEPSSCAFAFTWACVYVCLCAFVCPCKRCKGCKLQAIEWKSGILKALRKLYAIFSLRYAVTNIRWHQETGPGHRLETEGEHLSVNNGFLWDTKGLNERKRAVSVFFDWVSLKMCRLESICICLFLYISVEKGVKETSKQKEQPLRQRSIWNH